MSYNFSPLNIRLRGIGKALGEWVSAPELELVGQFNPSLLQQQKCEEMKEQLSYSEGQIVALPGENILPGEAIRYLETEFAMTLGRRALGEKVASLTVGTLLCCPERLELYVQKRSASTATYPGKFSMFGGHISLSQNDFGFGAVLDCLITEVHQEAGIDLRENMPDFPASLPSSVMLLELETGSLQYTPLCLAISSTVADDLLGSNEGEIVALSMADDPNRILQQEDWSAMGFSTIACWVDRGMNVQSSWSGAQIPKELSTSLKSFLL